MNPSPSTTLPKKPWSNLLVEKLPLEIQYVILESLVEKRRRHNLEKFLQISLQKNDWVFTHTPRPNYPYLHPFSLRSYNYCPKETLCFLWYLFEVYKVSFIFSVWDLKIYLHELQNNPAMLPEAKNLGKMLNWFAPISWYQAELNNNPRWSPFVTILFHNHPKVHIHEDAAQMSILHNPFVEMQAWTWYDLSASYQFHAGTWNHFKRKMCMINDIPVASVPPEVMTYPFEDVPEADLPWLDWYNCPIDDPYFGWCIL